MSKIDFSKAPDGATHFQCDSSDVYWYKRGVNGCWVYTWGNCAVWATDDACIYPALKEIPPFTVNNQSIEDCAKKEFKLTLPICKNEREVMLCRQVLRMCRGEASQQQNVNNEWVSVEWDRIDINKQFRSKPKKELVVPWEFIPDDVASIEVKSNGRILGHYKNDSLLPIEFTTTLKLDLTDIELPVTVERPTC